MLTSRRYFKPICTVRSFSSLVTIKGQRYWLNAPKNEKSASAAMAGRARGPAPRARNGTTRAKYVLYQCNVTTVAWLVRNVTSKGTIIVARNITKIVLLSGNLRKANAYAASTEVAT